MAAGFPSHLAGVDHPAVAEYLDERDLNIYTDGSSLPRPRRGGIGIRYVFVDATGHEQIDDIEAPGFDGATNNQMELQACIEALKPLATRRGPISATAWRRIVLWTDSRYVVENLAHARYDWPGQNWLTATGNPVANAEQWRELTRLMHRLKTPVEVRWVKGHKHSRHNKAADKLAKRSAKHRTSRRISDVDVRRKRSREVVELGSVPIRGQLISIRVITREYQRLAGMYKLKYEVVARSNPAFGRVDVIYAGSDLELRAGHSYMVRVNDKPAAPRVVKVTRELLR
jgi:ribonuclease HI